MAMPNKDQLTHLAGQYEAAARFLREHAPNALRITQDAAVPLRGSDDTGRQCVGDHSDPTGQAATAKVEPGTGWAREIADMFPPALKSIEEAMVRANDLLVPLAQCMVKGKPKVRGEVVACANVHGCPDDKNAEQGFAGRCETCYRYRKAHEGTDRRGRFNKGAA